VGVSRAAQDRHRGPDPTAVFVALALVATVLPGACKRKEDRFTGTVVAQLKQKFPGARITVTEPLAIGVELADAGTLTLSLENVFRDCHGEIEGCESAERVVRGFGQTHISEDGGDPAAVRPVIKDAGWMAEVERMYKKAPPDKQAGNRLVTLPFVADLAIVYVFDLPDGMRMVSERDREKLGLSPSALYTLARKNLDAAFPGPMPDEEIAPGIHQVNAGDSYEASRLLLDDRWRAPAAAVKGDLLVAAPTRDFLLYTGSHERPEVLTHFRKLVGEYEQTRGHPVSRTILRRTSAGWQAAFPR
jgi:Protein of unknown function (DUF1444)